MDYASIRQIGAFAIGATPEEEHDRVHVVLAQVCPSDAADGTISAALPKLEQLATRAAKAGADVIVFPEFYLTGTTHDVWQSQRVTADDAHRQPSSAPEWIESVQRTAARLQIAIITGSAIEPGIHTHASTRMHTAGQRTSDALYNNAYFIDWRGKLVGAYTKRNLWHAERPIVDRASVTSHPDEFQPPTFIFETRRGLRLRSAMVMCVRSQEKAQR